MIFESVHNIWTYNSAYTPSDGAYAKIFIRYDKEYETYKRKVVDVLGMLGGIGGLANALKTLGFFFVFYFTNSLYSSKIIRKVY